jgi:hypothetical protein
VSGHISTEPKYLGSASTEQDGLGPLEKHLKKGFAIIIKIFSPKKFEEKIGAFCSMCVNTAIFAKLETLCWLLRKMPFFRRKL